MSDERNVLPSWMTDGKGIRGDTVVSQAVSLEFPAARITEPVSSIMEGQPPFDASPGGQPGGTLLPFAVLVQAHPTIAGRFQKGVYFNSLLYKTRSYKDTMVITGLLTSASPSPTDSGWSDITPGASDPGPGGTPDDIWLEITGSPASFGSPEIRSLGAGDTFDGGEVESDNGFGTPAIYTQTYSRKVLARIWFLTNSPDASPHVDQRVFGHLVMLNGPQMANVSSGGATAIVAAVYPEAL